MESKAPDSPFEVFCLKYLQPICDLSWMDESWTRKEKKRICFCKRSKCKKGYCECFADGRTCSGCGCVECLNTDKESKHGQVF